MCRPTLQSKYDSLAFAVHAFMLADGYKLVAVGDHAERQLAGEELVQPDLVSPFKVSKDTLQVRKESSQIL